MMQVKIGAARGPVLTAGMAVIQDHRKDTLKRELRTKKRRKNRA
jgi:hypothetical protein